MFEGRRLPGVVGDVGVGRPFVCVKSCVSLDCLDVCSFDSRGMVVDERGTSSVWRCCNGGGGLFLVMLSNDATDVLPT